MDKQEYKIKLDQINKLAEEGDFKGAADIVDTIDWRHVKSVRTLCMVAEIYEANKRYDDAIRVLKYAYRRSSSSKTVLYRLAELSIRQGDPEGARAYAQEFEELSPNDSSKYILRYKIARADGRSLAEQIRILEELKEREYTERWAYELARLYYRSGQENKCVDECDDMILWFSEGRYVTKAMELKMQIRPLTPAQQKKYDSRYQKPAESVGVSEPTEFHNAQTAGYDSVDQVIRQADEEDTEKEPLKAGDAIDLMDQAAAAAVPEDRAAGSNRAVSQSVGGFGSFAGTSDAGATRNVSQTRLADSIRAVFSGMQDPETVRLDDTYDVTAEAFTGDDVEEYARAQAADIPAYNVPTLEPESIKHGEVVAAPAAPEGESGDGQMTLDDFSGADTSSLDLKKLFAETTSFLASEIATGDFEKTDDLIEENAAAEAAPAGGAEAVEEMAAEAEEAVTEAASEALSGAETVAEAEPEEIAEPVEEVAVEAEDVVEEVAVEAGEAAAETEEAVEETAEVVEIVDEPFRVVADEEEINAIIDSAVEEVSEPAEAVVEEVSEPAETVVEKVSEPAEAVVEEVSEPAEAIVEEIDEPETITEIIEEAEAAEEIIEEIAEPAAEAESEVEIALEPEPAIEPATIEELSDESFSEEPLSDEDLPDLPLEALLGGEEEPEDDSVNKAISDEDLQAIIEDVTGELPDVEPAPTLVDTDVTTELPTVDEQGEPAEAPLKLEINREEVRKQDDSLGLTREYNFMEELQKAMDEGASMSDAAELVRARASEEAAGAVESMSATVSDTQEMPFETVTNRKALNEMAAEMSDLASYDDMYGQEEGSRSIIENIMEEPERLAVVDVEPRKLDETEVKVFSYFAKIPGIAEQVTEAIADVHNNAGDKTSRSGNIVMIGRQGSGKTRLADALVLAVCKDIGIESAKLAHIIGEDLNKKDPAQVVSRMAGGFLVIEGAGAMNDKTVEQLNAAMEFRTDDLVVILEDEKQDVLNLLKRHPVFAEKFSSYITIPVFTNDELVTFGKTYCKELGYKMDEMCVLALYTMIGDNQKDREPVTVGKVRDMIDAAIARAEKGSRRFGRKLSRKETDPSGRVILHEKDFNF